MRPEQIINRKFKEIEINFIYYVLWEKLKESES